MLKKSILPLIGCAGSLLGNEPFRLSQPKMNNDGFSFTLSAPEGVPFETRYSDNGGITWRVLNQGTGVGSPIVVTDPNVVTNRGPYRLYMAALSPAEGQAIYYADFNDPNWNLYFRPRLTNSFAQVAFVDAADGAKELTVNGRSMGRLLRGNSGRGIFDPIMGITTPDHDGVRYSDAWIRLASLGITNEFVLDGYFRFDANNTMPTPGMKFFWCDGSNAGAKFNFYILLAPDFSWFYLLNNPPTGGTAVGETLTQAQARERKHAAAFSQIPGASTLWAGSTYREWFLGRWHHVRIAVTLNTPGQQNGRLKMAIDNIVVLDVEDRRFRDSTNDHFSVCSLPGMVGGGVAPKNSFGWQIDEFRVYKP